MSVFDEIVAMVEPGATVLDLGCEDCTLLARLIEERDARGRGVDIDDRSIQECIRRGISVFHGNLDEGLKDHRSGSYDYVVLSRTLQQVYNPATLLDEMVRVGRRVIVNFPNFGYLSNRLQLSFRGRMPVNRHFPIAWYDTPNIHFFTRRDFRDLCRERDIPVLREIHLRAGRRIRTPAPNLFATEVCCLLQGRHGI